MSADAGTRFRDLLTLLADANAPVNPDYVSNEVETVARAGLPAAATLAATVAAAGFGRSQSWRDALDWLGRAAAAGDARARAQLELLAPGAETEWPARANGVDVAAWTAARPQRWLIERPRIGVADGFLEPWLCSWLIERAQSLLAPSMVYNPATGKSQRHDIRNNSAAAFSIADLDVPMLLVRARIANTMKAAPPENLERFSIFHYAPGERFSPHPDYLDPREPQLAAEIARRGQRIATFLVYLNGDFEGGATRFVELDRSFRPEMGGAVFFYNVDENGGPEPLSLHEGMPPTRGEKWLLSQFIRDQPQFAG